jgi:hypothetical protein
MKMRYFKYLLIGGLFVFASCDVTDIGPLDQISEEVAFTTPEKIELSMNGVYDAAQSGFYGGNENNNRGYIFGAAHVQQNDMRGEDMLLINIFYGYTYEATYNATTANNVEYWQNGFRLVNLVNLFIEGVEGAVEDGIIDEGTGNAYIGEARLLRAMAYHEMVIMFARPYNDNNGENPGLPIRTVGVNSAATVDEQIEVGRSSVADVYKLILEDLNYAETNLPVSRSGSLKVTRATRGAAIGLKTRVYLHMGQYNDVITEADKLVPESAPFVSPIGGYQLTEDVEGPWANNTSTDNIFSIGMSVNDNLNVNAALANMLGSSQFGARGEVAISPLLWNETFWHEDDLRRGTVNEDGEREGLVAKGASGRLFTTKYRDYTTNTDYAPIIRYAEVLLNLAEAEARVGDQDRALELLNAVRDRALAGSMSSYSGLTGNALVEAILRERRIEFLAEGLRWKDIHRQMLPIPAKMGSADVDGDTYKAAAGTAGLLTTINSIPYSSTKYLWPIPASEISSNPTLAKQQNPGY